MKLTCDFHIHSALSPCGDMDMTPNNIVNMALLNGLSMIALTDHNTAGNVRAVEACAKAQNIVFIPGMELETAEEAHFVCLFETVDGAESFSSYLKPYFLPVENRPDIFGLQAYMNEKDEITGYESQLLTTALTVSVYDVVPVIHELGGIMYPAHVNKESYSIISNLGTIPKELEFKVAEISRHISKDEAEAIWPLLKDYLLLSGSDAHYLWDLYEGQNSLDLEELSIACLFNTLRKGR